MRTARSLPYRGISMTETPPDRYSSPDTDPLDRDPLDRDPYRQRPPGQRPHSGQRPPLDRDPPDRDPPGQRLRPPLRTDSHL